MKLISVLFLFITMQILFISCSVQELSIGTPKDIKVDKFNFKEINISGKIPIENPNNFGFTIKKIQLDLYVNETSIGELTKREKIYIAPNSKETYKIGYNADLSKTLKENNVSLIKSIGMGTAKFKMKGYVKVSKFFVSKKIKVEYEDKLKGFKIF